jgi:hypothetical protein
MSFGPGAVHPSGAEEYLADTDLTASKCAQVSMNF